MKEKPGGRASAAWPGDIAPDHRENAGHAPPATRAMPVLAAVARLPSAVGQGIDPERVANLRRVLRSGDYRIDAYAIAVRMLDGVRETGT